MAYGLVDEGLFADVRWVRATRGARALWITALSWCADQEQYDGLVPRHMLRHLGATVRDADCLVTVGLWLQDGDDYLGCYLIRRKERRADIPLSVRTAVYERDGFACVQCGSTSSLSLDHIKPWSLGGADTIDNLQTMCRPCNSSKGATY